MRGGLTEGALSFDDVDFKSPLYPDWYLIRLAFITGRWLNYVVFSYAAAMLLGYWLEMPAVYRPLEVAATHPSTAFSLLLLSITMLMPQSARWLAIIIAILVSLLSGYSSYIGESPAWMPFNNIAMQESSQGLDNVMGLNTSVMLMILSFSIVSKKLYMPCFAQVLLSVGLLIPSISLIGYSYSIIVLFGQMSLSTTLVGFLLCYSVLLSTANRGAMRALLVPHSGGTISRIQIALGFAVPFLVGFLLFHTLVAQDATDTDPVAIYIVFVIWFITIMVCLSAMLYESIDVKRRSLERVLLRLATEDSLTGILNRRKLLEMGQQYIDYAERSGDLVWCFLIDIDHFKNVNDTAGHAFGDEVLKSVATLMQANLRKTDACGRLGGEEFGVILFESSESAAMSAAEKLRNAIEQMEVDGWTEAHGPITVSIGVASNDNDRSLEETLMEADKAMYLAKEQGRNRVMLAADVHSPDMHQHSAAQ